jgi:outer membrane receptor protein involved in Fe transport
VVQRRMDCHGVNPDGSLTVCDPAMYMDGSPDEDPLTGDILLEEVDRREFKTSAQSYQFVSKLNFALSPEHQAQLTMLGTPVTGQGIFGVSGSEGATRADFQGLTSDIGLKWTSKLNDNKTELEVVAGWHRDKFDQDALDDSVLSEPTTRVFLSNLSRFGRAGGESERAMRGCSDSAADGDPYPLIENCPVFQYALDSPGFIIDNLEDRKSVLLKGTQRVSFAGNHLIKVGLDFEDNTVVDVRHFTGGRYYQLIPHPYFNQVRVHRFVKPDGEGNGCGLVVDPDDPDGKERVPRPCEYLDEEAITGQTFNWSAFAQNSWQVVPNLTLNIGVRYEEQRLRYASEIRDSIDPFTMEPLGRNAITLRGMLAPRAGILYDWTREGRSKVYASYGRFYESIPMALNDFSFSGTTTYSAYFEFEQCRGGDYPSQDATGQAPNPRNCPQDITGSDTDPRGGELYRGGVTQVAPGTRGQFMDEVIVGTEYEIVEDLTVGVAVKDRRIKRVLEDVSIDNAETYIIGNPGFFPAAEEERLRRDIAGLPEGSTERALLEERLDGFLALRAFDRPRREHQAVELTAVKRVSRNFFVQGSYTYSRTMGNYPGLLNDDTGQALPNISTQYDLPELLANRYGPLPQDRPHSVKVDGYYTFDFDRGGRLTTGIRLRGFSGSPIDALGAHYLYGFGESYLLPRGSEGRTPFVTNTDLHLGYARKLAQGYDLSVFMDVINLFNQEQTARFDQLYTFNNVNPIVGGSREDLVFAKQIGRNGGESRQPIGRNIGFKTPLQRFTPLFLRLGARFTF